MRHSKILAGAVLVAFTVSGCATFRDREWGSCAVGGAIIGGTVGGVAGGTSINNVGSPTDAMRAAAIMGGVVGGALLGGLLGHAICDPMKAPPPPPPPPPPPAAPQKIAELKGTNFDFDKAVLKPEGRKVVEQAVDYLKANPKLRVLVDGHTDSIGSDAYNLRLSERRAQAVKAYMIERGLEASRITAKGLGESSPVADNKTEGGRARNRRVEILAQ